MGAEHSFHASALFAEIVLRTYIFIVITTHVEVYGHGAKNVVLHHT